MSLQVEKLEKNMAKLTIEVSAEEFEQAIEKGEKIAVYGDYDVDGVTSVSLLYLYLEEHGADVEYYIPSRIREGYGLSVAAIDVLKSHGVSLMITVDTGITAIDEIAYAAKTGRFHFLKDTCCDAPLIRHRLKLIEGTNLKLFNANAATILDSLQHGAAGFSGIMANFHPQLYVWLCRNWDKEPEKAKLVQSFLGITSDMEGHCHPVGCKYFHRNYGVPMTTYSRTRNQYTLSPLDKLAVEQFHQLSDWFIKEMNL